MIQEIRVSFKDREFDVHGQSLSSGLVVDTEHIYYLQGVKKIEAVVLARACLCEPLTQTFIVNPPDAHESPATLEIGFKSGVMNPQAASILKAARLLGIDLEAVDTATAYHFPQGTGLETMFQVVRPHGLIERVITKRPKSLLIKAESDLELADIVRMTHLSDGEYQTLRHDRSYTSEGKLKAMIGYFEKERRDPTVCEVEAIEGRWSEHCGHETFNAKVLVDGVEKPPFISRIKEASRRNSSDKVVSAFVDNSGVIRFFEDQAICAKVETHNSPCALEPYGGAMTGSGGVFRDILGTGQGAKVIVSTDMFCFAPPDMDLKNLPEGCLPPEYLLRRVVAGVRDYGNPVGIPTSNGSIHFDESFRAKPTVIVGGYGIIPESRAQKGQARVGDIVVTIGGRTGKDGIHGATFSSRELRQDSVVQDAHAVQIGNPIEEKRVIDAVLEARDLDLVRAITDCGAAGFSSAIGEMGERVGVEVDIKKAPLKYQGLLPWEIWMSESQERMILAADPNNLDRLMEVCQRHNVEATALGNFTGNNRLIVRYGDKTIADLDYDFLQHGLPQRTIEAHWQKDIVEEVEPQEPADWTRAIEAVLADWSVCSKEPVVRQYDHGVQGTNALMPYSGEFDDGPNDGVVVSPILGKPYGMVVAHGLNPSMMAIDPYFGSLWAISEAMANYVSSGGDPKEAAWINNYIWPVIHRDTMGSLDRAVDAVCDAMDAFGVPVISGKDSLSSSYRSYTTGEVIEINPVLCLSVFGKIEDVRKTPSTDIKKKGSTLALVGQLSKNMGGTTYYKSLGLRGNDLPVMDLNLIPQIMQSVHEAIKTGQVLACHDISEGGVVAAISEMCFGGDCGVEISLTELVDGRVDKFLFNETAGCFIVELEDEAMVDQLFGGVPHQVIGRTTDQKRIMAQKDGQELFSISTDQLKQVWKRPMEEIFR